MTMTVGVHGAEQCRRLGPARSAQTDAPSGASSASRRPDL